MQILEREAELAQLFAALDAASEGRGTAVVIQGEPGIGKTALVRRFGELVGGRATLLWGTCDDLWTPNPLAPIWDIAEGAPAVKLALEENDRPRIFRLVLDLLRRRTPTVLVVEDAHWADDATLDLITHVGRRIASTRGLLIVTTRDVTFDRERRLTAVVADLPSDALVRIRLDGLSTRAIASLATEFGRPSTGLVELSGGNPLFVVELLRSDDSDGVPTSVRELTVRRLGRLTAPARDLLAFVSVVPGGVGHRTVERCFGDAATCIDECERQGLLEVTPEMLGFRHEIVRRAVEAALPSTQRRALNKQVLDEFVAEGVDATRLVHHARWAGESAAIVRYAPIAARQAATVDSHHEAVELYRVLGPHLEHLTAQVRAEVLVGWAREELTIGDPQAGAELAEKAVAAARVVHDDLALCRALIQLSHARWFTNDRFAAEAAARESVDIAARHEPPTRELARGYAEHSALAMMACRFDESIALADLAMAAAAATGDQASMTHALNSKGSAISTAGHPAGSELIDESFERAERMGYGYHAIRACVNAAQIGLAHHDLPRAERFVLAGRKLAIGRQRASLDIDLQVLSGYVHLLRGDFEAADNLLRFDPDAEPANAFTSTRLRFLGRLQSLRGDPAGGPTLARAADEAVRSGDLQSLMPCVAAVAEHAWLSDDLVRIGDDAVAMLGEAIRIGHPWLAGELSLWLAKAGLLEEIPKLCAEPFELQLRGGWAAAAERWNQLGRPYERARALADGDVAARLEALLIADRSGLVPLADRLRRELRVLGVAGVPRRKREPVSSTSFAGLTPRQCEVLALVAKGLSNTAIASELFISARTAEHHVSAILAALQTTSRVEAAVIAERAGLLGSGESGASVHRDAS